MVGALGHKQDIALQILAYHEPGRFTGAFHATDAQTLPLADGVVHQTAVLANNHTLRRFDSARLSRQVLLQKIFKAPLANEADTGTVLLVVGDQPMLLGNAAHL